jgi:hypothetical protein
VQARMLAHRFNHKIWHALDISLGFRAELLGRFIRGNDYHLFMMRDIKEIEFNGSVFIRD